jgi:hypothetical protein
MDSYTAIDLMRAKFKENWNTPVFKVSGDAISLMATTYQYSPEYNPEGFPVSAFGVDGCFPNNLISLIQSEHDYFRSKYGQTHDWEKWTKDLSARIHELELV